MDASFQAENVRVHMITTRILFKDMWPEARSAADENALYEELMKRFDPKTADDDGLYHQTLLLVAKK